MIAALLLVQAVSGPPVPLELRKPVSAAPCPQKGEGDDIVVCGRQHEPARLAKLPEPVAKPPSDPMTFRLPGGAKGNVHAIQSNVGGFTGQGAALTLTLPFGKKKAAAAE